MQSTPALHRQLQILPAENVEMLAIMPLPTRNARTLLSFLQDRPRKAVLEQPKKHKGMSMLRWSWHDPSRKLAFPMVYDSNSFVSKQIGNEDRSCDEADHLMFKLSYLTHPARLRFGCSRPRWSSMPRCSDKTSSMNSVSASSISPQSTQTHHLLSTAAGYKSDRP